MSGIDPGLVEEMLNAGGAEAQVQELALVYELLRCAREYALSYGIPALTDESPVWTKKHDQKNNQFYVVKAEGFISLRYMGMGDITKMLMKESGLDKEYLPTQNDPSHTVVAVCQTPENEYSLTICTPNEADVTHLSQSFDEICNAIKTRVINEVRSHYPETADDRIRAFGDAAKALLVSSRSPRSSQQNLSMSAPALAV